MAQSNAQVQAAARKLEAKALAMPKKSDGMRLLLNAGQSIVEVRRVFNAPYGFVYGVADRAGLAETAASRRTPRKATKVTTARAAKGTAATKATAKTPRGAAAKVAATVRAQRATAREAKVTPAARVGSARKAQPVAKVAGRPTAARRAANRKASA